MLRLGSYFTKSVDDDEMGNTDEDVASDERHVPHMVMRNLVTAIRSKNIPADLNKLLKSSNRFRIHSYVDKSQINDSQYASNFSRKGSRNHVEHPHQVNFEIMLSLYSSL